MMVKDIAQSGDIHENTAHAVLHVAEDFGVLSRDKP